jgi:hypothetical protein
MRSLKEGRGADRALGRDATPICGIAGTSILGDGGGGGGGGLNCDPPGGMSCADATFAAANAAATTQTKSDIRFMEEMS